MQRPQRLRSLALGYNMRILRGCCVSDSFLMVIGDQVALRRHNFAPFVSILQAVTVVLSEVNSVCNIHSRVQPSPRRQERTPVEHLQPFERVAL